ncbi:4-carboxymuconolactone decarboxylase [Crossiella sp. SN42]|uniref:4-carboxymuconolactone decarboxylase n=1 Tax=Crossiella sp. SN42 TaxID=2944808 RepID=UPI0035AB99A3
MDNDTALDVGSRVRREVLGDAHVERSLAKATAFSRPLQELVTEYCWGTVWARPGLPRGTRSLLTLVMLTALGRGQELRLHVRGALNNGVTPGEIREALLQAAIYCGVPAALEAFRGAEEVFAAEGVDLSGPTVHND